MIKSGTSNIILATGAVLIVYLILKSWGIIRPGTILLYNKPITLEDIKEIDLSSLKLAKEKGNFQ